MIMTSYTIEQLVDKVNSLMSSEDIKDARVSSQLSVRRVRDYQSKGLLREPIRVGRNSYYDEQHVEQLVALRSMQSSGLSDGVLKKITDSSPLYYQSSDLQVDTVSNQSQVPLNSISASFSAESNEGLLANDEMKKKALSVLDKLANNASPTVGVSAATSQVNMQSLASSVLSMSRSASNSNYATEKQNLLDKEITGATRHQNRSIPEPSLSIDRLMKCAQPTPVSVKSYQVFDGVRLDIEDKAPLSKDDKELIMEKLTKIISSM